MDREDIKENLATSATWIRGLFMLLFGLCYSIAEIILFFISVFQFLHTLVTGSTQPRLLELGKHMSEYVYQIYLFLTFNSEDKPFPFGPWPGDDGGPTNTDNKPAKKKTSKKKAAKKTNPGNDQEESPKVDDDDDEDAHEAHLGV